MPVSTVIKPFAFVYFWHSLSGVKEKEKILCSARNMLGKLILQQYGWNNGIIL